MSLTVRWYPSDALSLEVYESTNKEDVYNPANKKATLAPNITEYVKNDELADVAYYFGIKAIYATGSVNGPICQALRPSDTGVGPGAIILGDTKVGVFGRIQDVATSDKLPTMNEVRTLFIEKAKTIGGGGSYVQVSAAPNNTNFHKVMSNGRILYIPITTYVTASTNTSPAAFDELVNTFLTGSPMYIEKLGRLYELKLGTYDEYCAFMTPQNGSLYAAKVNQLPKNIAIYTQVAASYSTNAGIATYFITSDKLVTYYYSTDAMTLNANPKPSAATTYATAFMCYLELVRG